MFRYRNLMLLLCLLVISACSLNSAAAQSPTPPPLPTDVPPLPKLTYTEIESTEPLPFVLQRFPRRGEELAPDGVIELVFDRPMNPTATAGAFTLQQAAQSPTPISGEVTWPNAQTLRFTPKSPLNRETIYDVILTQKAIDSQGLALVEPFTFRFNTQGYLTVTQVIPKAETQDVETNATITVMFNRPVVPLTSLAEADKFPQPLDFDPPLPGQGQWLNTSIYVFTPSEAMAGGTTYTARVKKGLADAAQEATLSTDFTWQFTTQPPQAVWNTPNDGATLVGIETPIQITFNQPIDLKSAQERFSLTAGFVGNLLGSSLDGQLTVDGATLTFTPTERLEFDTTYQVTLEAGVTSATGGQGSKETTSYSFTTVPLPQIIGTDPSNGTQTAYPYTSFTIRFNTPVSPATIMPHVSMEPPLPITPTEVYTYYSPWDNSFTFHFGAKPSTDYEVRITPGISDPYGNKTSEDLTVKFRTDQLDPTYQLLTAGFVGMYDAGLPAKMLVQYTNINQINLKLYQLKENEIFKPEYEWQDYVMPSNAIQRTWTVNLEAPLNKISYQPIDLVENGGKLAPGLYLLEVDSPQIQQDYNRRRRHVLLVTETGLTLKAGVRDMLVWATDLATGQPKANQKISFYDNGQRLGEATTDKQGIAQLELNNRNNHGNILAVIMPTANGSTFSAVAENWNQGISPYDFGVEYAYSLPSYNAHIYTDRPIYRPAQTVYIKGILRSEDDVQFKLPDVGQAQVTVRNPNYENIYDQKTVLSAHGTFTAEVKLAEGAPLGIYSIAFDFAGQHFEQPFTVAAYRAPEFEVTVTPAKTELERGQDTQATINTRYFFGGPLAQAKLTWNVVAESYAFTVPQLGGYKFYDSDDPYTCFDCWWWRPNTQPQSLLSGEGTTNGQGELTIDLKGAELEKLLQTGSYRLTIEASVTGSDNQVISGRQSLILHKGNYYIGLSPQDIIAHAEQETAMNLVAVDWAGQRLANKTLNVQIIRYEWVNSFTTNESGGGYWSYETKKELIDTLSVTTNDKGEAVAKFTPPQGGSYQIVAQDEATLVKPTSPDQETWPKAAIRSAMFIWATGKDQVSWRRENNDRITLISDKAIYAPGETAKILIPSPLSGEQQALITIERGRIIRHEVIAITSTTQVYELPITDSDAPNIFVSVVLVQGRNAPAAEKTPPLATFKMGLLPLEVTPVTQKLTIKLTPDTEQAEPGQEVSYQVQVTDQNNRPLETELSLDLVDKAVLSLMPRMSEAIVQAYYQRRGLAINTSHNLTISINRLLEQLTQDLGLDEADLYKDKAGNTVEDAEGARARSEEVIADGVAAPAPAMKAEAVMGEEEMAFSATALPQEQAALPAGITVREEFSDTAYWNPIVMTDGQGQGQVTLKLPDNLTTWVMRGVGVTDKTQVGEATVELVSTKPLLIRPVTPRFFVVDDRAEVAANVSNNTDKPLVTTVMLSATGVIFGSDTAPKQTVTVPARGESKVSWNISVIDVPTATLTFAAISGEYQDAAKPRLTTGSEGSLVVYRYTAPDIVGTAGQLVQGGSRTEIVALPPLADPETGKIGGFDDRRGELTVQLDPSLAAGMQDGLRYLEHYEYECAEQTVSRFLPNLLTYKTLRELGLDNPDLMKRLPQLIDEGLGKLYLQQKADGGWGWWADNIESNVYVTSYVVFALTKAKQADIEIKPDVLQRGQQFLLQHLQSNQELNYAYQANNYAFMLYVLAEDKQAPSVSLTSLYEVRHKLSHYGRAYLALALSLAGNEQAKIDTLLSDLNNAAILSATGAHWEEENYDWWGMNTDTRSTAIILDTLVKLDPQNELIPNVVRWLMVARKDGIWETTQETAWALIAFTDLMKETGELKANYDFTVSLNQAEKATQQVSAANVQESTKLKIALSDLLVDTQNRLTVSRSDGNGRLYYSAHLKVYLPVKDLKPAERGIQVSRRYTLESCEYVKSRQECPEVREAKLGEVIRVDLTIIAPHDLYYVMVEDPLPAGAEAIDTGLATTSLLAMDPGLTRNSRSGGGFDEGYYPFYWWWWRWYSRSELRDEKVVLFADYLPKGSYEYSYTMRATLPGDYQVIPTLATEMYFPEVFGRSDGRLLSIGR